MLSDEYLNCEIYKTIWTPKFLENKTNWMSMRECKLFWKLKSKHINRYQIVSNWFFLLTRLDIHTTMANQHCDHDKFYWKMIKFESNLNHNSVVWFWCTVHEKHQYSSVSDVNESQISKYKFKFSLLEDLITNKIVNEKKQSILIESSWWNKRSNWIRYAH